MSEPVGRNPLFEIARDIKMCRRCPLGSCRENAVPGAGSVRASIFLIGEAPGQHEDQQGEPFVGKAGRKLDEWLQLAGLDREHMYLSNVLKCRPEDNKFPEDPGPVVKCLPFLHDQLRVVNPLAIIVAGKQALQHVILPGSGELAFPFDKWVGRVCRRRDLFGETRIGVMYHPAYVLRTKNPREEQQCISLLRTIKSCVVEKQRGEPAPLIDLYDVKPASTPVFQQKFRLFGGPSPT